MNPREYYHLKTAQITEADLDDEKRAEYLDKKAAIGVILKARANKEV